MSKNNEIARIFSILKFQKLDGPQKKKLVIALLNHLIEQIDEGEKDSEFEILLKTMVPPMVDGFSAMLKAKQTLFSCCLAAK